MRAVDVIRKKRDGDALSRQEIDAFVAGVVDGSWADYQTSALLMAIVLRGMSAQETTWLTDAMVRSGDRVDLSSIPGTKVGKHSTGGVGDKVSIVLAPLAAACGVVVPKMSGRGLGHTGGTLDKLEAIPGFRVALSLDEFRTALARIGCALISQTSTIAPADKTLYALRDVTGTVESIPLISASVMSKKLAEGSNALVLDVKCGRGAFMKTRADALSLARSLVAIGTLAGVRTEAFVTAMASPLGCAVGNALEIAECVDALRGQGPPDLQALVLRLASRMVVLSGRAADETAAAAMVSDALTSGAALRKFRELVANQGGDVAVIDDTTKLPAARTQVDVFAPAGGWLSAIDADLIGRASMRLGAGRDTVDSVIDHAAGIVLRVKPGQTIAAGDPVATLHVNDESRVPDAVALVHEAIHVAAAAGPAPLLVLAWVRHDGETVFA